MTLAQMRNRSADEERDNGVAECHNAEMGAKARSSRRLALAILGTVAVGMAGIWLLYYIWHSPPSRQTRLIVFWTLVATLATTMGAMAKAVWGRIIATGTPVALDDAAEELAKNVQIEWEQEAVSRGLMPSPIPVHWGITSLPLSGPSYAAITSAALPPIAGISPVSDDRLREGVIDDLHAIYGGLGSGRLIIAGKPGAGKTGASILLLLAALRHRRTFALPDRAGIPVPVMFSINDWDPRTMSLASWLVERMRTTRLLRGARDMTAVVELLKTGRIAVILDGLDEVTESLRPIMLEALSRQATFRLVVVTRIEEMANAATRRILEGAAAIELRDVDHEIVVRYMKQSLPDPAPLAWRALNNRLKVRNGIISKALTTPLALTLFRDVCSTPEGVREFLDFCHEKSRHISAGDITDYLLDRIIPAAYHFKPGDEYPAYEAQAAERALRYIAVRMHEAGLTELEWWKISSWAKPAFRIAVTGLGVGLAFGLTASLACGLTLGTAIGYPVGAAVGAVGGVSAWFMRTGHGGHVPGRLHAAKWRQLLGRAEYGARRRGKLPPQLAIGATGGLVCGAMFGMAALVDARSDFGSGLGTVFGISIILAGVGFGLAVGSLIVLVESGRDSIPLAPLSSWRADRVLGVIGGVSFGVMLGLADGLVAGLVLGARSGLVFGLLPLACGLAVGVMSSETWAASLSFLQIAVKGGAPLRLIRFLEDARQRNVLRAIGPAYQFRHDLLRDRLAGRPAVVSSSPGHSPAV